MTLPNALASRIAGIFGFFIAAINGVVEIGDGLAQILIAGHRRVLLLGQANRDAFNARGRIRDEAGFRGTLAEVRPVLISVTEAMRHGFVHDVNHAGTRDKPETGDGGLFGAVQFLVLVKAGFITTAAES